MWGRPSSICRGRGDHGGGQWFGPAHCHLLGSDTPSPLPIGSSPPGLPLITLLSRPRSPEGGVSQEDGAHLTSLLGSLVHTGALGNASGFASHFQGRQNLEPHSMRPPDHSWDLDLVPVPDGAVLLKWPCLNIFGTEVTLVCVCARLLRGTGVTTCVG